MKTCFKCNEEKPLSGFYKHQAMADGHLNKCINCAKTDVVNHRRENSERVRQYDRERYKKPARAAAGKENAARWNKKNPAGYKAHYLTTNAVRDGRLKKKPCLFCDATKNLHSHHMDYSKPLEVIWLCARCHHRLHANFPHT